MPYLPPSGSAVTMMIYRYSRDLIVKKSLLSHFDDVTVLSLRPNAGQPPASSLLLMQSRPTMIPRLTAMFRATCLSSFCYCLACRDFGRWYLFWWDRECHTGVRGHQSRAITSHSFGGTCLWASRMSRISSFISPVVAFSSCWCALLLFSLVTKCLVLFHDEHLFVVGYRVLLASRH